MDVDDKCTLCTSTSKGEECVTLGQKGVDGIKAAAKFRGEKKEIKVGTSVHKLCRQVYTNPKFIQSFLKRKSLDSSEGNQSKRTRGGQVYNSQTDCLYCGKTVLDRDIGVTASCVRTQNFVQSISSLCAARTDDWALQINGRINYCLHDLHAYDFKYHHQCNKHFRAGAAVPQKHADSDSMALAGRPVHSDHAVAFSVLSSLKIVLVKMKL